MTSSTPPMESITFKTKSIYWAPNHFNNVLLQNNNGPCFLISLVNSLILSQELTNGGTANDEGWTTVNHKKSKTSLHAKDEVKEESLLLKPKISQEMLVPLKTLLSRPDVRLTELLSEITNLLLNLNDENEDLSPILDRLSSLHTGLSVNPDFHEGIFDTNKNPVIGICDKFGLKVIHGWLLTERDKPEILKNVNDYDSLIDLKLKLVDKINKIESSQIVPSPDSFALESAFKTVSNVRQESDSLQTINQFLEDNATELTEYGIAQLKETDSIIKSEEICIFFRNNHFNTIYKKGNELYLLLIDEGFKMKRSFSDAIVWESLTSINGSTDVLVDGNFQPVQQQHQPSETNPFAADSSNKKIDYNDYTMDDKNEILVAGTQDELLALSLQQEEDEKLAKNLQKQYNKKEADNAKSQSLKKGKKKKKPALASHTEPRKESSLKPNNATNNDKNCVIM